MCNHPIEGWSPEIYSDDAGKALQENISLFDKAVAWLREEQAYLISLDQEGLKGEELVVRLETVYLPQREAEIDAMSYDEMSQLTRGLDFLQQVAEAGYGAMHASMMLKRKVNSQKADTN